MTQGQDDPPEPPGRGTPDPLVPSLRQSGPQPHPAPEPRAPGPDAADPATGWRRPGRRHPGRRHPLIAPPTPREAGRWAMGAHIGGVFAFVPLLPLIPALTIYLIYRGRHELIRDQSLEAVNFQVCIFLAWVAAKIIDAVPLLPDLTIPVWLFSTVFAIVAGVAALRGGRFRYPLTHRFFR